MKSLFVFSIFFSLAGVAQAQIDNFPGTLCSISYGGTSTSPKSEFPGQQGVVGEDANYKIQVLFSQDSAEVRITDKKTAQLIVLTPATSELGTFKDPIGIISTETGKGTWFTCAALKTQVESK